MASANRSILQRLTIDGKLIYMFKYIHFYDYGKYFFNIISINWQA